MANIEILKELSSTKYRDFKGFISIDTIDGDNIIQLCKNNCIDMDKYYLLAFELTDDSIYGIGGQDSISCNVLLLEQEVYGNNYDQIVSNVKKEDSVIVIKKHFLVKYADLKDYIKRFNFMAATTMINNINSITISE